MRWGGSARIACSEPKWSCFSSLRDIIMRLAHIWYEGIHSMEGSSPLHGPLSVATHTPAAPGQLRMRTDPLQLRFDEEEEETASHFSVHQPRAEKALALGIRVKNAGHVFVCGPSGTSRKAVIEEALERHATPLSALRDYVSVFPANREPRCPQWLALPAGKGRLFLESVDACIRTCQDGLRRRNLSSNPNQETLRD